ASRIRPPRASYRRCPSLPANRVRRTTNFAAFRTKSVRRRGGRYRPSARAPRVQRMGYRILVEPQAAEKLRTSSSYVVQGLGMQALGTLLHLELRLLAFGQRAKALRLDRGVVAEDVLATAVLSDESVALRVVEPLHGTSRHSKQSFLFGCGLQAGPELWCWVRASVYRDARRRSREHPVSRGRRATRPRRATRRRAV